MYTLSLEIINKCNLNCTYCYLGEKKNTYMSLETAQKAIDIAVHEANKQHDRTLMVYFIGGEPLMAFNLMKDVVDYAKKKCQETNLICKFSTTINGTLVTDEVIDFFVENTFEVKVSLDGPEYVQNLNRRDYAGTGSFEKIMKNLPLLRKYEQETGNQISVASVVTSNNYQYYAESFQFLLDLGIKKLESGIDYYCSMSFKHFPAYDILPFWADDDHTILDCAIRYYTQEVWNGYQKEKVEKVEIFKADGIYRYIYQNDMLIADVEAGEHENYFMVEEEGQEPKGFNWTRIPLVPFKYNKQEIPLIRRVKTLQDGINTMISDFENNMQEDARNTILVLKNYDGENLGEFRHNLSTYGAVKVREDGGVETLQVEINAPTKIASSMK